MVYSERRDTEIIDLKVFRKESNIPAKDGHGRLLKISNSEQLSGNVFPSEICLFLYYTLIRKYYPSI